MHVFVEVGCGMWVRMDEIVAISDAEPTPDGQFALARHRTEAVQAVVLLRGGQLIPAYHAAGTIVQQLEGSPVAEVAAPGGTSGRTDVAVEELPVGQPTTVDQETRRTSEAGTTGRSASEAGQSPKGGDWVREGNREFRKSAEPDDA